jgi:galactokinase
MADREDLFEKAIHTFRDRFELEPAFVVRGPGRVNLIGEHTDYNDGFVLPIAIDRAVWIAGSPVDGSSVELFSVDFGTTFHFDLDDFERREGSPLEYLKGIAWALQEAGHRLVPWRGVMVGDVPIGAGLSSSAAMQLAVARAFGVSSDIPWDPEAVAHLVRRAENEWVGVQTGLMDQMIGALGKEGHALLLDCRSLETEQIPMPPGTSVVVLDTSTRRKLATSAYNERFSQCAEAAAHFGKQKLRDVPADAFDGPVPGLDEVVTRRGRHVVGENLRVLEARSAMLTGDTEALGRLLNESHLSLRDDFEVTNDALDTIVEISQSQEGCFGARMTGAGFGGCAVALVDDPAIGRFSAGVASAYKERTGLDAAVYVCQASDGAEVVFPEG